MSILAEMNLLKLEIPFIMHNMVKSYKIEKMIKKVGLLLAILKIMIMLLMYLTGMITKKCIQYHIPWQKN